MANIHNVMEEYVVEHVNALYDQVKSHEKTWLSCDCQNCRMDTVCYVLNRIAPRYVVSGRGVTHNANMFSENNQISVDIDKLCVEGMRLVNAAKRPYHAAVHAGSTTPGKAEFNFPTVVGNVFDGLTFEPMPNAFVTLKLEGENASMMDETWPNPCQTYKATAGSYSFWVAPQSAAEERLNKNFMFTVEVTCEGYEPASYSFTVPLVSESSTSKELDATFNVKVKDIFLFKKEENEK